MVTGLEGGTYTYKDLATALYLDWKVKPTVVATTPTLGAQVTPTPTLVATATPAPGFAAYYKYRIIRQDANPAGGSRRDSAGVRVDLLSHVPAGSATH